MDSLDEVVGRTVPDGWIVVVADPPAHDPADDVRFLDLCRENTCGSWGTNWGCPPGWDRKLDSLLGEYDTAVLLEKTFACAPTDAEGTRAAGEESHRTVREAACALRREGFACMGFSDGGCRYCGVCSYPEPCRFPDMLVPSISAIGLDLGRYLEGLGRRLEFRDDRVTLYGLLLVRARTRR